MIRDALRDATVAQIRELAARLCDDAVSVRCDAYDDAAPEWVAYVATTRSRTLALASGPSEREARLALRRAVIDQHPARIESDRAALVLAGETL